MGNTTPNHSQPKSSWVRIPDGTRVKHRHDGQEGVIDGLTELVTGPQRNPDGRTQYRMNIGGTTRVLVTQDNLNILLDHENLVMIGREKEPYRRYVTDTLRGTFVDERFIKSALPLATKRPPRPAKKALDHAQEHFGIWHSQEAIMSKTS